MKCLHCNEDLEIEKNTCSCPSCGAVMIADVYAAFAIRLKESEEKLESYFEKGKLSVYEKIMSTKFLEK